MYTYQNNWYRSIWLFPKIIKIYVVDGNYMASFCLKLLPSDRSQSTPPQTFLGNFKISKGHKIAIKLKRIWFFNTALTVYGKCYLLNVETSQMYKYVDTHSLLCFQFQMIFISRVSFLKSEIATRQYFPKLSALNLAAKANKNWPSSKLWSDLNHHQHHQVNSFLCTSTRITFILYNW